MERLIFLVAAVIASPASALEVWPSCEFQKALLGNCYVIWFVDKLPGEVQYIGTMAEASLGGSPGNNDGTDGAPDGPAPSGPSADGPSAPDSSDSPDAPDQGGQGDNAPDGNAPGGNMGGMPGAD